MNEQKKKKKKKQEDIRLKTTQSIWGMSIAMFGISIPLAAVTQTGALIPILVMAGATLGTAAVWAFSRGRSEETALLGESIQQLRTQIAALEMTINDEALRQRIESASEPPEKDRLDP